MLFYSPLFLFLFLPAAFLLFFAVPKRLQNTVLLSVSFFFYFFAEPKFALIALASAIADYWICKGIHKEQGNQRARYWLALGVMLNLSALVYFKYMDFFIQSINSFLTPLNVNAIPFLKIALPIGVSFIVFEKITYLVDVYRGIGLPAKSLRSYLLYVFMFPKLLAGPIVKYHDIAAQLATRKRRDWDNFFEGFKRFLLGLVKKLLLADTVGEIADKVFGLPLGQIGFGNAWLGMVCFTLQIYLDFSAYSDMAIGLARMFGFRLLENFNMPYIATSFTDFWRRWHISLSTWIKEYLYYPLGGNRGGQLRTYMNLWVCFLLSGLWHGASWTFVLWGAYNGVFLVIDKLGWLTLTRSWPRFITSGLTLLFVMIGWVIFRSTSLEQAVVYLSMLFSPSKEGVIIYIASNVWWAIGIGAVISLVPLMRVYDAFMQFWRSQPIALYIEHLALMLFSLLAISRAVVSTFNPFLYFRF